MPFRRNSSVSWDFRFSRASLEILVSSLKLFFFYVSLSSNKCSIDMYTWAWKKHIQIKTCSKHENQSQVVARRRGRERTHTHPESDLTPDSQCNPSHDPILKYLRWANSSKPVASRWGTWSGSRCKNRQVNPPRHPVQVLTTWLWFRHSGTVE